MTNSNLTFGKKAADYFTNLKNIPPLPSPVSFLNPYLNEEVMGLVCSFFNKFYNDFHRRIFIFGINPGRFGGGITGISFTDPSALRDYCGIHNNFLTKRELSSTFIYHLIEKMGGTAEFFAGFYLTALFPFALISSGKNINYYDKSELYAVIKEYISYTLKRQAEFGAMPTAVSLGKKNAYYLNDMNDRLKLFNKIIVLEHPRYIMQYKRKSLGDYLDRYARLFSSLRN